MRKRSRVRYAMALGLAMLVSAPFTLPAQSLPEWRLTRNLRIDAAEEDLSRVTWIEVSPTGTIVVSQPQDTLLVFYDAAGKRLGTFGRGGSGPGEFRSLGRYGWLGDTLWVADAFQRRTTFIGPDRKMARMHSHLPNVTVNGKAVDSVASMLGATPWAYLPGGRMVVSVLQNSRVSTPWPSVPADAIPLLHVTPDGNVLNLTGSLGVSGGCSVSYQFEGGSGSIMIPFCARPVNVQAVDGSRFLAVLAEEQTARRVSWRAVVTRPTGDTVFSRRYDATPVAISRAAVDSAMAAQARVGGRAPAHMAAAMTKALEGAQAPPVYPPTGRAVIGRDDTIWVELYSSSGNRTWQVLDGKGAPVARVTVPRNIAIHVASRSMVWALETDEDGLQHIVRYAIADRP